MKKYIPILILIIISLAFFYKTILFGKIPFPGDLLVSGYAPWNHQSYGGYVAGAVPSKDQYFDVIRELYPWRSLVTSQLKQGKIPLWNPYNFSGAPLLANYQSQVFYPLSLVYQILPQISAWTLMVVIQPVLGTIFMYLFAKEIGLGYAGAILASLLFNFSSFASVWIEFTTVWHTILWLPLLLYLVERSVKQKFLTIPQQILFIFGLYSAITGGHPQDFINSYIFLVVYTILRTWHQRFWGFVYLLTVPFFLAAPQLFPTIELFRHSSRVAHDYQGIVHSMLVQVWQLPLIIAVDFFGNPATKSNITGDYVGKTLSIGVVGFLLAIVSLKNSFRSWHMKFFVWVVIIILALTVRTPISEFLYKIPWPLLSTGTPTRILFLFMFASSILAGFGYDYLQKTKKTPVYLLAFITILITLLFYFSPIKRIMYLTSGVFILTASIIIVSMYKKIFLTVLIILSAGELFYNFIKFNPFVPKEFVFPQNKIISTLKGFGGFDRFWAYGTGRIEANFATQTGLFSADGTDPLNLSVYNRFLQSSSQGKVAREFNRITRSDAQIAIGYGEGDLPNNHYRLRVMDVLGVKYVLDRAENPKDETTFPHERFKEIAHIEDWIIYENLKSAPRFFVTHDVRPYTDDADFEKQFFDRSFDPAKTVLVPQGDWDRLPKFLSLPRPDAISLTHYTPTNIEFSVNSDISQFLFLSDTFDNGWVATINGVPTQIYRANYAFRGIVLPKGTFHVKFIYQPRSFTTGLAISIVTICMSIAAMVISAPLIKLTGKYQKKTSDSPSGTSTARKL